MKTIFAILTLALAISAHAADTGSTTAPVSPTTQTAAPQKPTKVAKNGFSKECKEKLGATAKKSDIKKCVSDMKKQKHSEKTASVAPVTQPATSAPSAPVQQ